MLFFFIWERMDLDSFRKENRLKKTMPDGMVKSMFLMTCYEEGARYYKHHFEGEMPEKMKNEIGFNEEKWNLALKIIEESSLKELKEKDLKQKYPSCSALFSELKSKDQLKKGFKVTDAIKAYLTLYKDNFEELFMKTGLKQKLTYGAWDTLTEFKRKYPTPASAEILELMNTLSIE